ncbi:MAG: hypothetical protein H0U67_08740 [Gemmatimonadetes bacterium]|nr:hypothetical protein [Gemmatimonadota bacterium]
MRAWSLLALRITVALLVLHWGLDKILDPGHALRVSDNFYGGLLSHPSLIPILGILQVSVALLALAGALRQIVDPLILLINLGTMMGVWRSVVDPWGWFLEGTNALFFPSVIVVAGCLVLIAFRDQEGFAVDRWWAGRSSG